MDKVVTASGVIILTVSMLASGAQAHAQSVSATDINDSTHFIEQRAVGAVSTASSFKDVPTTHWAHNAIETAVAKGLFKGYSDGTFRPNAEVTREEFAVLMARVSNNPVNGGTTVPGIAGRWSEMEIEMAIGQGFVNPSSYANGFNPTQAVNRLEMATWLVNGLTAKYPAYAKAKSELQNGLIPVAEFYKGGLGQANYGTVGIAVGTGMLTGFQDGTFGPSKTTTRAEVAVLLLRYSNLQNKAPDEFPWLKEMREIATTGTNMVSKGYSFANAGRENFSQIRNVQFSSAKGLATAKINRIVVVDFVGDPSNPYTKMFMGTKNYMPRGKYSELTHLLMVESTITPSGLKLTNYDSAFGKVGGLSTALFTNGMDLYGYTALPRPAFANDYPNFFTDGAPKTVWTVEAIAARQEGPEIFQLKLKTGEVLCAIPPGL